MDRRSCSLADVLSRAQKMREGRLMGHYGLPLLSSSHSSSYFILLIRLIFPLFFLSSSPANSHLPPPLICLPSLFISSSSPRSHNIVIIILLPVLLFSTLSPSSCSSPLGFPSLLLLVFFHLLLLFSSSSSFSSYSCFPLMMPRRRLSFFRSLPTFRASAHHKAVN